MKPRSFEYTRATSLEDIFVILDEIGDEAKILAGGQSLVPAMNMRIAAPEVLIDVADVAALKGIHVRGDFLTIGAMCTHTDLLNSADVAKFAPLISQAMPHVAHVAIRNRGTFGGSLCNADPGSELPACMVATNAQFTIQSSSGTRVVTAGDFFHGPFETAIEAHEVLVSVDIPIATKNTRVYFDELTRRKGDFAMAGIAVHSEIDHGIFTSANLTYFGVVEKAVLAETASKLLLGCAVGNIDDAALCRALEADITPFDDLTTSGPAKMHMMKILTRRALSAFSVGGA